MPLFGPPNVEKLKSRKDVSGLIKALVYTKKPEICLRAAEALGEIGDPGATEPLLALLEDEIFKDEVVIFTALGRLRDPKAVDLLIERLKANGISGRPSAELSALQNIGEAAVAPLLKFLEETAKETRQALVLIECLEKIGDRTAFTGLKKMLSPRYPNLLPHLVDVFVQAEDTQAIPQLVDLLKQGLSEPWATKVVEGLLEMGWQPESGLEKTALYLAHQNWSKLVRLGPAAVEFIFPLLRNSRSEVILKAVETLGEISDVRAIEPLAGILEDRRPELASAAARSLGNIGSDLAVEPLLQAYLDVETDSVKSAAKQAMLQIGKAAVPHLITRLESMDPEERYISIELLGNISDPRALQPLITQLKSMDIREKRAAVISLGLIGDSQAIDALVPLRENPSLHPDIGISLKKLGWDHEEN